MIRTMTEIRQGRVTIQETGTSTTITVAVDSEASTYDPNQAAEVMAGNYVWAQAKIAELEKTLAESRELVTFKERVADGYDRDAEVLRGEVRTLLAERKEAINGRDLALGEISTLRQKLQQAERDRDTFKAQVREYDQDRKTERDKAASYKEWAQRADARAAGERQRADENKAWAERAETRVAKVSSERGALRESLQARERLLDSATRALRNISGVATSDRVNDLMDQVVSPVATKLATVIREIQEMSEPWAEKPGESTSQA